MEELWVRVTVELLRDGKEPIRESFATKWNELEMPMSYLAAHTARNLGVLVAERRIAESDET